MAWFARHQSNNGKWDVDGYPVNCSSSGPRCEPGLKYTRPDGDIAMTGYALLCFLGAGYDHASSNTWREVVAAGLDYLLQQQDSDGQFREAQAYGRGIAAYALVEAYGFEPHNLELQHAAQQAINVLLARQNDDVIDTHNPENIPGGGWDYRGKNVRNDLSITGWNVMALKVRVLPG